MRKHDSSSPLILILEDQPDTMLAIKKALKPEYNAVEASSIAEAELSLEKHNFSAFVLDLNLPDGSSFDFVEKLKKDTKSRGKPILILTASEESEDIVLGFNLGIDDFITKPFNCFELKARLNNRIAKMTPSKVSGSIFLNSSVSINPNNFEAIISSQSDTPPKSVKLTRIEIKILTMLHTRAPNHISRESLCDSISDIETYDTRKVDQHIKNIRKKLSPITIIKSSYGIGYYLNTDL